MVDGVGDFNPAIPSNPLISFLINMLETLALTSKSNKGIGRNGRNGLIGLFKIYKLALFAEVIYYGETVATDLE
jgi:hypothetical protein